MWLWDCIQLYINKILIMYISQLFVTFTKSVKKSTLHIHSDTVYTSKDEKGTPIHSVSISLNRSSYISSDNNIECQNSRRCSKRFCALSNFDLDIWISVVVLSLGDDLLRGEIFFLLASSTQWSVLQVCWKLFRGCLRIVLNFSNNFLFVQSRRNFVIPFGPWKFLNWVSFVLLLHNTRNCCSIDMWYPCTHQLTHSLDREPSKHPWFTSSPHTRIPYKWCFVTCCLFVLQINSLVDHYTVQRTT